MPMPAGAPSASISRSPWTTVAPTTPGRVGTAATNPASSPPGAQAEAIAVNGATGTYGAVVVVGRTVVVVASAVVVVASGEAPSSWPEHAASTHRVTSSAR